MDTNLCFFLSIQFSLLFLGLASSPPTFCHENERSALLEFKKSFFNKTGDSCFNGDYENAYKKIESWKTDVESGNCCAWDGIECDANNNHVIGVELGHSCLSGRISSGTTLFHLVHLERLNLSENSLVGQVPPEILRLTNLLSLDLSYNYALELKKPSLLDMVQNLTKLEILSLSLVDISASIPIVLANLSSLRTLILCECNLQGEFPPNIFKMLKLEFLDISYNYQLSGHLPEFHWRSPLKSLEISYTNFSGQLPSSLGNLASLNELFLRSLNFIGQIPFSLGNLTQLKKLYMENTQLMGEIPSSIRNLTQLTELSLHSNQLTGAISSWIGQLSNLEYLDLSFNKLKGGIPSSIGQQYNLKYLNLGSNKLAGEVPSSFINLTRLTDLDLSSNQFSGQILPQLTRLPRLLAVFLAFNNFTGSIPGSISEHKDLQYLDFHSNSFNGTVEIGLFLKLRSLHHLFLSFNKLSLVDDLNDASAYPTQFWALGLASCNLSRLPTFLQHQDSLNWLDLSSNSLSGEIPEWFLAMNTTVGFLNLSSNSLTSSVHGPLNFRWKFLGVLDLRNNYFKGSLPIPPTSIEYYFISRNKLSGNIPPQTCELRELRGLDLSENNLTGVLPQCFNNLSQKFQFLSLHHNNFTGEISSILGNGYCNFLMVDVSGNQFHGSLPRSLTKCHNLEFLNLGSNRIKDVFPFWLGSLRFLRVLILHSNEFHGEIGKPKNNDGFPSLQIVDLSFNSFENCLPSMYFEYWQAMKNPNSDLGDYMGTYTTTISYGGLPSGRVDYTMIIDIKGLKMSYPKIQSYLTFIDLSNNNFSCEIPKAIEDLTEVQYLNFSNNHLTGPIPSFLKALTNLQSLDLSQNKFNGKIPQELTQLTFLGTFNVSYNNLSGRIPEGRQFGTFDNNSYLGNTELCGMPLSKKGGDVEAFPQPLPQSKGEVEDSIEIDWKVVLLGYGGGLLIGIAIGQRFPLKPPRCILKYFGRRAQIRRW